MQGSAEAQAKPPAPFAPCQEAASPLKAVSWRFTIDGEPAGKKRVAQGPKGGIHRFKDRKTERQETDIGFLCRAAMGADRPMTGAVKVLCDAIFAIPPSWPKALKDAALRGEVFHTSKPDSDNIAKLVKDALNKVAWDDDGQVAVLLVRKRYGHPERIEVSIDELSARHAEIPPPQTPAEIRRTKAASDRQLGLLGRTVNPHNAETPQSPTARPPIVRR